MALYYNLPSEFRKPGKIQIPFYYCTFIFPQVRNPIFNAAESLTYLALIDRNFPLSGKIAVTRIFTLEKGRMYKWDDVKRRRKLDNENFHTLLQKFRDFVAFGAAISAK